MGSLPQLTQSSDPSLTASRLRRLLEDAVEGVPADGILLSGGLGYQHPVSDQRKAGSKVEGCFRGSCGCSQSR